MTSKDMEIYGQFNLGFMIAGLRQDLFIVDQVPRASEASAYLIN